MKILAIGDVHGRSDWKDIVKHNEANKVVFLGDYLDSFDIQPIRQYENLIEIIEFAKQNTVSVELLLGNHDIQYYLHQDMISQVRCSGYNPAMHFDFYNLFKSNKSLFKIAYQYKNYLFTHAGLHRGWYNYRFREFHKESEILSKSLNRELEYENPVLWDCGFKRGGSKKVGGPLWADFIETYKKPLQGYHQIVGHTRMDEIKTKRIGVDTSVTYIDVQDLNNYKCSGYILEFEEIWQTKIMSENL